MLLLSSIGFIVSLNNIYSLGSHCYFYNRSKKRDKKKKKKKRSRKSSTSSSNSSNSSSDSDSDSNPDDGSNWAILHSIWPVDKRPPGLRKKRRFNAMSLDHLLSLAKFDRENLKSLEGDLATSFSKDKKPLPTKYKAARDDGFKRLHPARFSRYPLGRISKWWKRMPRTRNHQFKNLPLLFSGSQNKNTQKTIAALHDRTKTCSFKMFHSGNINVAGKPIKKFEHRAEDGVYSTIDFAWESPTTLGQVTDALLNYATCLMMLWPYDQTGLILFRVINKYNYMSCAPSLQERVNLITTFFNTILRENSSRAGRRELVMSFAEQEDCLKTILTSAGYSSVVPAGRNHVPETKPRLPAPAYPGPAKGIANNSIPRNKVVMYQGFPICFGFNNGACRNTLTPYGCKDSRGKEFAHQCNKYVETKKDYCLGKHKRVNHP